ncbi:GNAT family N-acetyltransferase [Halobiforma nitratireducens]|uniref:GCN5-like N-acetyltransferase n=1 Tax=Halobiforma nitratireducens JCM 10879 TaxID=1227454 RepID=M0MBE7_9EURY|nr:GNAT family N-acetyltransferase [Halobiforma nitratireducens]EMA43056.1 GCN5-like N-acetyltransferase [Halobiforma nitratireducens JCM 10879]
MEIRDATPADVGVVRSIAEESLNSTYTEFLDEETIEEAVEQWYGDDFEDVLEDDHALVLVVERDGEVVAFSQSELVGQRYGTGQVQWLHVGPDHRGDGTGVRLLVRTRERLLEEGADQVQGFVLEDNEGGNRFYEEHGFERAGQREVDIGSETFTENVYVESDLEDEGWGAVDELEIDDEQVYVSYGEAARGSQSPFYSTYRSEDRKEVYAWLCGSCDSLDNAMDTMGRIECNVCGNRRKATRWDASYL